MENNDREQWGPKFLPHGELLCFLGIFHSLITKDRFLGAVNVDIQLPMITRHASCTPSTTATSIELEQHSCLL